jgi:putative ABC transport system permease protein
MLFVRSEFSYDRFNTKSNRIYRVWQEEKFQGEDFVNTSPHCRWGPLCKAILPEVEAMCRVYDNQHVNKNW